MIKLDIVCKDQKYLPEYATPLDACLDLKVRIDNFYETAFLEPNQTKVFGTGIQVKVPKDHVMLMFPRSSTGVKLLCRLAHGTGVIDSGYRDEVKIALHNFGDKRIVVNDGQRIAQFMIIPRPKLELNLVEDDEEFRQDDRGGGIGSTNEM